MTERRVVVTGIGTINPLGNNIAEFFSNLEKELAAPRRLLILMPRNLRRSSLVK